jgi:hypothetical protein
MESCYFSPCCLCLSNAHLRETVPLFIYLFIQSDLKKCDLLHCLQFFKHKTQGNKPVEKIGNHRH